MTEKDNITRVYTRGIFSTLREMFPVEVSLKDYHGWLWGDQVKDAFTRADYIADSTLIHILKKSGNPESGKMVVKEWSVLTRPDGERFSIDVTEWNQNEKFTKLAEHLETRTGRKGLTIIAS